ncbi:hypothetical protein EYF80_005205 [Liparis tanakae]|uniref:Uncharacterized protein n=1 Tax=Liparis tanakae TaxID=230148 RepID=A0A4Z2J2C6_9TELE|nr:hypothetical protein EYF80_005205 [Liparis tanakae]
MTPLAIIFNTYPALRGGYEISSSCSEALEAARAGEYNKKQDRHMDPPARPPDKEKVREERRRKEVMEGEEGGRDELRMTEEERDGSRGRKRGNLPGFHWEGVVLWLG